MEEVQKFLKEAGASLKMEFSIRSSVDSENSALRIIFCEKFSCPEKNDWIFRPGSNSSLSVEYKSALAPA